MEHPHVTVLVRQLPTASDLPLPAYSTSLAAGLDLLAAVAEPVVLLPGEIISVPTGIALALPPGYEAQIRPRSGLAAHTGVTIVNSPGTVDADYRGEILAILINHGKEPFSIARGMRIAQLVVKPVPRVRWSVVDDLPTSPRGEGGLGHTGR